MTNREYFEIKTVIDVLARDDMFIVGVEQDGRLEILSKYSLEIVLL
jgi:hypothetical protein